MTAAKYHRITYLIFFDITIRIFIRAFDLLQDDGLESCPIRRCPNHPRLSDQYITTSPSLFSSKNINNIMASSRQHDRNECPLTADPEMVTSHPSTMEVEEPLQEETPSKL
jgi:hypothetical protein